MLQAAALALVSPRDAEGCVKPGKGRGLHNSPDCAGGAEEQSNANLLEDNQRAMLRVALTACS